MCFILLLLYLVFTSLASWLLFSNKVQFSSVCANFADKYMDGENEVLNYINKLRTNSSSKPDGLPPILFKRLKHCFRYPLALLYNQLISVSALPAEWLTAHNPCI